MLLFKRIFSGVGWPFFPSGRASEGREGNRFTGILACYLTALVRTRAIARDGAALLNHLGHYRSGINNLIRI